MHILQICCFDMRQNTPKKMNTTTCPFMFSNCVTILRLFRANALAAALAATMPGYWDFWNFRLHASIRTWNLSWTGCEASDCCRGKNYTYIHTYIYIHIYIYIKTRYLWKNMNNSMKNMNKKPVCELLHFGFKLRWHRFGRFGHLDGWPSSAKKSCWFIPCSVFNEKGNSSSSVALVQVRNSLSVSVRHDDLFLPWLLTLYKTLPKKQRIYKKEKPPPMQPYPWWTLYLEPPLSCQIWDFPSDSFGWDRMKNIWRDLKRHEALWFHDFWRLY